MWGEHVALKVDEHAYIILAGNPEGKKKSLRKQANIRG
jgi:hypothetical protein